MTTEEITEESKDKYTWELFAKDLALSTHLNHSEAWTISYELRHIADLHPFECFQTVQQMAAFLIPGLGDQGAVKFASRLVKFATHCAPKEK